MNDKFKLAAAPEIVVPREDLMEYLDKVSSKRFMYVHAPAGYGKTVSAALWISHNGAKSAWLRLDGYDNNLADFCLRFASVLLRFQPVNSVLSEIVRYSAFNTAPLEFALRAITSLSPDEHEYILVVDDLHLINNSEVLRAISAFIGRLPPNFKIMFLSRVQPPDIFSELIVKNELVLIETEHLIFTVAEIKQLFQSCGHKLTEKQAKAAYASTDGWAMGVNALLLSGSRPSEKKRMREYLNGFLKTEIWDKWNLKLQNFLIKTSVAEDLTPSFCRALSGEDDSGEILNALVRENAFISMTGEVNYRLHHLFRDFLLSMLGTYDEEFINGLYQKAAEWYFAQGEYYKATEYFMKCKYYEGVARGLRNIFTKNSTVDNRVAIVESLFIHTLPEAVMLEYPFILVMLASIYFSVGNPEKMMDYADRFTRLTPKIAASNPDMLISFSFVRALDFRKGLIELTKELKAGFAVRTKDPAKSRSANLTQNLPFFHRSQRDYSEYTFDTEPNLAVLRDTFGFFIGSEYDVMEDCIRAGLNYEQGNIPAAHKFALSANSKLEADYTATTKFCAMIILAAALYAARRTGEAEKIIENIGAMLEHDRALFLIPNLRAYIFRLKINNADSGAADEWLRSYAAQPYTHLEFYKIFQRFTTARAYITTGDNNNALIFLEKLLALSEIYRRPLDVLEALILLSIAYKRNGNEKEAYGRLERAVVLAKKYNYTQMFTNEGPALSNMLHKLSARATRRDYTGGADVSFVKRLYFLTHAEAKHTKGLTGGITPKMKLTRQQKLVMRHMANGYSYNKIAENMGLKYDTVRTYIEAIYNRLEVSNSNDAVIKVREFGLLDE